MSDVSVIGFGAMGAATAQTLLDRDYAVAVWNRTPGRAGLGGIQVTALIDPLNA